MTTVKVQENREMGWFDVQWDGQTWRFSSMESVMKWVEEVVGNCKVEVESD